MKFVKLLSLLLILVIVRIGYAENELKIFVDLHNEERESLGISELEWSEELKESAQLLVNTMAFKDKPEKGDSGFGENTWHGENNEATFEEIFDIWSAGKTSFLKDNTVPQNCSEAWQACEQYSQIVWKTTTQIGCASASSMDNDFIVCHYNPAGNIEELKAY